MKISKKQLKQIIREELNEMGALAQKTPIVIGKPAPGYVWDKIIGGYVHKNYTGRRLSHAQEQHLDAAVKAYQDSSLREEDTWPDKESSGELGEVLGPDAEVGEYIEDFQDSDAPQFKGKSKKKKAQMAYAAHAAAKEKRGKKWWHKQKHLLTHG